MHDTLNLVRGAVSTKDLLPVLTHFHIYAGRVQGGNGRIAIDAPCPELAGFDCTVPAERFLKAIDACDGEPKLKLTDGGKLTVSKGKFRATLPLADHASFPRIEQAGSGLLIDWGLLPILRKLYPFIGEDASRPWSCGVLFREGYAWATNNTSLARAPASGTGEWLLPVFAIDELLRVGREPEVMKLQDKGVELGFEGGWWMRCQKLEGEWPDVAKFMPAETPPPEALTRAGDLAAAVRKVLPFCPDPKFPVVQTGPEGVSTLEGEMSAAVGHEGLPSTRFRAEPLLAVLDAASGLDLAAYPAPCYWRGDGIDGVLVGMRA